MKLPQKRKRKESIDSNDILKYDSDDIAPKPSKKEEPAPKAKKGKKKEEKLEEEGEKSEDKKKREEEEAFWNRENPEVSEKKKNDKIGATKKR